ncbi:methyl-accepting chemotaxis protein [Paraburkholderia fungorum]|uniref:Methyl-accepting chemotaxis protein n=1 Tax=Paraburkholderia fungorum TaxID=134537 RepID=A0AAP5QAU4_9BURK|nr:methyl-accepting chemotaxis protein [Paraburkholderia fungorum]MDT8840198.1 methyl-accepting chemotaxis protein [Paraburkholderia fungorum]
MSIVTRLTLTMALFAASLLAAGGYGVWQLHQSESRFENFSTEILPAINSLDSITANLTDIRIYLYRHAMTPDAAGKSTIEDVVSGKKRTLDELIEKYSRDITNDTNERKFADANRADLEDYKAATLKFMETSRSGDMDASKKMLFGEGLLDSASKKLRAGLAAHVDYNMKLASTLRSENDSAYLWSILALSTGIGLILLVAGVTAFRVLAHIRRSLRDMQAVLQEASDSLDLTQRAPVRSMDEIGQTATAFNALISRVAEVLCSVRSSSESVSVASQEIASGNTDLSARTEEQAASLEETASSMTQLTGTVKQNADNARQANALATNATDIADTGNEAVQLMVGTIGKISDSSTRIADITALIEGIAFQTNILALNAAVEAARAGEQGRGFAVVASEVRSLAQRSAAAAKEIKELIGSSAAIIQDGSKQAVEVGATMSRVKQAIKQVSDIVGEIAAASEEQSRGIEQVNQAVNQMDEVTQQNAALVEQAAAAAHSLEEQATALKTAVAVFTVNDIRPSASHVTMSHSGARLPAPRSGLTRRTAAKKSRTTPAAITDRNTALSSAAGADWHTF